MTNQVVELSVKLRVDVAAWELAYGEQGGEADLAEDVRSFVQEQLMSTSQRPVSDGGEGGIVDVDVDHV